MPGMGELLIILVIVMLIFGAGKLPQIGDALGRSIKNFKRSSNGENEIEVGKGKELDGKETSKLEASRADEISDADVVVAEKVKVEKA